MKQSRFYSKKPSIGSLPNAQKKPIPIPIEVISSEMNQKKSSLKTTIAKNKIVVAWLQKTYPSLFNMKNPKPLKRGIIKDLFEKKLSFPRIQLRRAIRFYTNATFYHHAIIKNENRYDLEGNPIKKIEEKDRHYSQQILQSKEKKTNIQKESQ